MHQRHPKVLFYGSFHNEDGNLNDANVQLVKLLTYEVLNRNGLLITREGMRADLVDSVLPVDNIVLEAAEEWCTSEGKAMAERVLSICLPERISKGTYFEIDRKMVKLSSPSRYKLYLALLQESDLIVFAGGREGVARLGYLALWGDKKRLMLPLSITGGAAEEMVPMVIEERSLSNDEALLMQAYTDRPTLGMAKNLLDMGLNQKIPGIDLGSRQVEGNVEVNHVQLVEQICSRFHLVARQLKLRYSDRETLAVEDEYDTQDLLHSLLHIYFDDIRQEEWTPSYAGGCSRVDFLLKQEQIIIEVKKTRKSLKAKEVGEQLIIDTQRYKVHPDCKKLLCFVYDPDGWVSNPRGLENDLNKNDEDCETKVLIVPKWR